MIATEFTCTRCKQTKPTQKEGGTGYATVQGDLICYACCADIDRELMEEGDRMTLYLTCEPAHYSKRPEGRKTLGEVSNWPGTLKFRCHTRTGKHNIAGVRYDCWFRDHLNREWHGVQYGDNTQIVHCKRIKS